MNNIGLSLLANAYSGFSPAVNMAAASCSFNGQEVPCSPAFVGGIFALFGVVWILDLALMILMIVGMWKVYSKAGKPGWASLIPVYNLVVMLEIIGKPVWWVILAFIPFVNVVVGVIVAYHLAKAFGKGIGYAVGLIFLSFIFFPILGFGKAVYTGVATPATPNEA